MEQDNVNNWVHTSIISTNRLECAHAIRNFVSKSRQSNILCETEWFFDSTRNLLYHSRIQEMKKQIPLPSGLLLSHDPHIFV